MAQEKPSSSIGHNVTPLHGGEIVRREPNAGWVAECRKQLERAEAGETVGGITATLHSDLTSSYSIAGMIGPNSLLGASDLGHSKLRQMMHKANGDV